MFEARDQRASARRAASTTCAPVAWTKGGGLLSEVESSTVMFVVGQWICVAAVVFVYCKVYARACGSGMRISAARIRRVEIRRMYNPLSIFGMVGERSVGRKKLLNEEISSGNGAGRRPPRAAKTS